jgi:hypothetical protein
MLFVLCSGELKNLIDLVTYLLEFSWKLMNETACFITLI